MTAEQAEQATTTEPIASEDVLISMMRRLAEAKKHQEEQKSRANRYLEQIRTEIAEDLAPLEEEIERARQSIRAYLIEERGGESFRVPGLGSAGIQHRRQTRIVDEEKFVVEIRTNYSEEDAASVYDEPRFNAGRAKKLAESILKEYGEILPGTESEEIQTLTVRLSGGAS